MRASRIWTGANVLMLLVFLLSLVVQFNDPDPARWVAVYGLAAMACGLETVRRGSWMVPALVGIAALAGAAILAPRVAGQVRIAELLQSYEMKSVEVEEGREVGGLLIVAAWMGTLTWSSHRRSRRPDHRRS